MSDCSQQHYIREIAYLKTQLATKDEQISELKAMLGKQSPNSNSNYSKAKKTIESAIKSVQGSLPQVDIAESNELQSVLEEFDLSSQIIQLTDFLTQRAKAVPRLCAQLRGHVDFLTRLASSPHLQSLFLISDHSGSIFLPETARQLLLEQAARTSQLIMDQSQASKSSFGNIDTNLNLNLNSNLDLDRSVDLDQRIPAIKKLLSEEINDPNELSSLLLQEVLISSALQRAANSADSYLRQIYFILNGSSTKETDKNNINKHKDNDELECDKFSYDKVLHLVRNFSHKEIRNPTNQSHLSLNSIDVSNNSNEWNRWARRLYYGLTQLTADSQDDSCLRMAIEEAALTSIGTQVLQNRLKSLRIQKSVMKQPQIQKNDQIKFSTSLICVISCLRMISRANSSNMYSTKHKVSKWS